MRSVDRVFCLVSDRHLPHNYTESQVSRFTGFCTFGWNLRICFSARNLLPGGEISVFRFQIYKFLRISGQEYKISHMSQVPQALKHGAGCLKRKPEKYRVDPKEKSALPDLGRGGGGGGGGTLYARVMHCTSVWWQGWHCLTHCGVPILPRRRIDFSTPPRFLTHALLATGVRERCQAVPLASYPPSLAIL